jgi:AcrR family transcriptional regulator
MRAALVVLSRKGFEDTSVEDICLAAGYSKGGFYFHFRGKEDLLLHLLEEGGEGMAGEDWPPALALELWSEVTRNQRLRRLLSERYASRRRRLEGAARRSGVPPAEIRRTLELLLALEAGLKVQAGLRVPDVDAASGLVSDLLTGFAPGADSASNRRRQGGAKG